MTYCVLRQYCIGFCYLSSEARDQTKYFINIRIGNEITLKNFYKIKTIFDAIEYLCTILLGRLFIK